MKIYFFRCLQFISHLETTFLRVVNYELLKTSVSFDVVSIVYRGNKFIKKHFTIIINSHYSYSPIRTPPNRRSFFPILQRKQKRYSRLLRYTKFYNVPPREIFESSQNTSRGVKKKREEKRTTCSRLYR